MLMLDSDFWFEPVNLLARCSLNEALLWVWAQRVPIASVYREKNAFETLDERECEGMGIPPVPDNIRMAAQYFTKERSRAKYKQMPKDTINYYVAKGVAEAEAINQWLPLIRPAMELPAAELFLKLRRGEIESKGKRLPEGAEIIDFLEDENSYSRGKFDDLVDIVLPPEF